MSLPCTHLPAIRDVVPSAKGCEDCLSPNRHATQHFHATRYPLIRSFEPGETWGWCYVDEEFFDPMPGPPQ